MRCKHENADHLMPGEIFTPYGCRGGKHTSGCGRAAMCEQFRCLDCGAYLSLGESNDASEAVQVEMRAIEVVNARAAQRPDLVTTDEFYGWNLHECNSTSGDFSPGVAAGYLARCLWTHCDDHPDGDAT